VAAESISADASCAARRWLVAFLGGFLTATARCQNRPAPSDGRIVDGETHDRATGETAARWGQIGSDAGGDRAGNVALAAINTIRSALGLDVIAGLQFERCDHSPSGCLDCALHRATGGSIREDREHRRYLLNLSDPAIAARAAAALQLEHEDGSPTIPLPPELDSLVIADAFDLTFRSRRGMLVGWIEPNDTHQRLWDLHLFPGRGYPPDTEPAIETT